MTVIANARGRFHALEAGDRSAPVVLCLHGFPDVPSTFDLLSQDLADAGFSAVSPYLRGYAPSTLEGPFDVDTLVADVIAFTDALAPGRRVALVGHDWGAVITYLALAKAPERFSAAVTMAVPHPLAFPSGIARDPAQLRRSWYIGFFQLPFAERAVARKDLAFVDRLWRAWSPGFEPPEEHMFAVKSCLRRSMPAPLGYYRALFRPPGEAARRLRQGKETAGLRTPVLQLMGENDGCIGPRVAAGQAKFFAGEHDAAVIPGVGHFLHLEAPGDVNARIVEWLQAWAG